MRRPPLMTALEICAGGGGQAIGVEAGGFGCAAVVELEPAACATLRLNRPAWRVIQGDVREVEGRDFSGIDLLAGGVPCPPFSIAGKQLGSNDERDLFPEALRIIEEAKPEAVLLENVPGLASTKFEGYRRALFKRLNILGYDVDFRVLNASNCGVPQLRPRFVLVGFRNHSMGDFPWPTAPSPRGTVGSVLSDLMCERGWPGAVAWVSRANGIAPTLVGGSKKHGGPDLGPTRAKIQWRALGVDGMGIADSAPGPEFPMDGLPRLTVRMAARIQGFPDTWEFAGKKTGAYRQIGNAFPPPVAQAVASAIRATLTGAARNVSCSPRLLETSPAWNGSRAAKV
jgi:DNA (cytosine-5)-methyltransferase 1